MITKKPGELNHPPVAFDGSSTPAHRGMIVRQTEPLNVEMPFDALDRFVTRTEDFFIRCHFPIPEIPRDRWRLRIGGEVAQPFELNWEELRKMPDSSITATIECAGNGREFLSPKVSGAQWERGAVGNAVWTGVLLKHVLERAAMKPSATEIILTGTDQGEIEDAPRPGGKIHYARSLPVAKARDDVLLAWQMNGTDLTSAHGFPLRAIVPGWYGMASVKWLSDIVVTDRPFVGYYQSVDYAYWQRTMGEPSLVPITEMQVKAQIARPGPLERVPRGQSYRMRGAAWSCAAEIVKIEVSTDGGVRWTEARLGDEHDRYSWRMWEYAWLTPTNSGKATIMVRAFDAKGHTQPKERDPDRGGYIINEVLRMDVEVGD